MLLFMIGQLKMICIRLENYQKQFQQKAIHTSCDRNLSKSPRKLLLIKLLTKIIYGGVQQPPKCANVDMVNPYQGNYHPARNSGELFGANWNTSIETLKIKCKLAYM